jgi:EAL and modified HD-GYP domain-containing signal transduction protein
MQNIRIGRQPILDNDSHLCAYSIMYREDGKNIYSSAAVISSVLNKFGAHTLLGKRRAFVNVDRKFLMHDLILSIPKEFFIFSITNEVEIDEKVIERVSKLHDKGYVLSLEHIDLNNLNMYKPILKKISYIKLDIRSLGSARLKEIVSKLKALSIVVVADNIYDSKQYAIARDLGCDWFEGYFFAELKIIENATFEPTQMEVMKLYRLLMEDANIDEITKEFENNYEITLQLLQFINSGAFHFRNKISTIHHVLTLVGRIPLAQWLMMMIYSKCVAKQHDRSPLMLMVKNRTELMQNILKLLQPDVRSNMLGEAYFVGVLSLIDVIFGIPMKDILQQMHVSDDVKVALLQDEGLLGEIFALVRHIETFNTEAVEAFEQKYKLSRAAVNDVIVKSMENVEKFENPIKD